MSETNHEAATSEEARAAKIISDLVSTALLQPYREKDAIAALDGEIDNLYIWERNAFRWLKRHWQASPDTWMNAWAGEVVKNLKDDPDAPAFEPM